MENKVYEKIRHTWLPFEYESAEVTANRMKIQYNKVLFLRDFGIIRAGEYRYVVVNYDHGEIGCPVTPDRYITQKINAVPVDGR